MAPYSESESMALKRIKVALKKKNWDLFQQGIQKTRQMLENGYRWSNSSAWQELLNLAEPEYVPSQIWEDFSLLVKELLKQIEVDKKQLLPVYEAELREIETLSHSKVVFFYNQNTDNIYSTAVKKYRITLNNLIYNANKSPEPKWFEDLAKLINSFDKPNNDLTGFLSLVSLCKQGGAIISSSYDNTILKNLVKSNMDFSVPDIKLPSNMEKSWEIYPLAGLTNCFVCSNCGTRSIKTDFASKTLVGSCSRCGSPSYPDLYDISGDKPEVNPKIWWEAFGKLTKSTIWIVINPPAYNEQPMIRDMIRDAAGLSRVEKVYIVSPRSEIGTWWKNTLAKLMPEAEVKDIFTSITSLIEDFKNIISKVEEIQNIEAETKSQVPQENLLEEV